MSIYPPLTVDLCIYMFMFFVFFFFERDEMDGQIDESFYRGNNKLCSCRDRYHGMPHAQT